MLKMTTTRQSRQTQKTGISGYPLPQGILPNLQGSNGDTDIENRLMDTGWGEERVGGIYRESNMETYASPYVQ